MSSCDPVHVVGDVPEQGLHLGVDRQRFGALQAPANLDQRHRRVAQAEEVAAEVVEALHLRLGDRSLEHPVLGGVHLGADRVQHREVGVDDGVQHGVEDVVLPVRQRLRRRLAALADGAVGARSAVAHRDHVAESDEEVRFAERDPVLDHLRGARDHEQRLAVLLQLGPLVGVAGILDGELVQAEKPLQAAEERVGRFEQPDPDHMARASEPLRRRLDRPEFRHLASAGVHARRHERRLPAGGLKVRGSGRRNRTGMLIHGRRWCPNARSPAMGSPPTRRSQLTVRPQDLPEHAAIGQPVEGGVDLLQAR